MCVCSIFFISIDRVDIDATPHPIPIAVSEMGFRIPMHSWKPSEFRVWIEALKKKTTIHNPTSVEIVNLPYNYSDSTVSEYTGLFLGENLAAGWTDLLQQLTIQYREYVSAADAARELVRIRFSERKTLSELDSRVLYLAKIAFKNAIQILRSHPNPAGRILYRRH